MPTPPSAGNPVNVGPFKRIVGFHWPTTPPVEPAVVYGIPGLQLSQEQSIPWDPYVGHCGLLVRVGYTESSPVWVNKYQGDDLGSLSYVQPWDYCLPDGGNIHGGADFFVSYGLASDLAPYIFQEKEPHTRFYSGATIGLNVWKKLLSSPVEWVSLGGGSVDLGGLSLVSTFVGGPTYYALGFIEIQGEWVLQVTAGSS